MCVQYLPVLDIIAHNITIFLNLVTHMYICLLIIHQTADLLLFHETFFIHIYIRNLYLTVKNKTLLQEIHSSLQQQNEHHYMCNSQHVLLVCPGLVKPKNIKFNLSINYLRSKSKDCLVKTQDNVSKVQRHVYLQTVVSACWSSSSTYNIIISSQLPLTMV